MEPSLESMSAEAGAQVSSAAFRSVLAEFISGVTVVTTRWQGVSHALTATAFCSVSLEPPLILVCVGKATRFHTAVTRSDGWAVSLLSAHQAPLAHHFSRSGRDLLSQFDDVPHALASHSGAPLITGARGWLDCSTHAMHDGGDHTIVVGRVVHAGRAAGAESPLTYHRAAYNENDPAYLDYDPAGNHYGED